MERVKNNKQYEDNNIIYTLVHDLLSRKFRYNHKAVLLILQLTLVNNC